MEQTEARLRHLPDAIVVLGRSGVGVRHGVVVMVPMPVSVAVIMPMSVTMIMAMTMPVSVIMPMMMASGLVG